MLTVREIFLLATMAILGGAAGYWCAELFGQQTVGTILAYGGLVNTGFFVALRWMNTARAAEAELAQFDETTRENYATTLRIYWQRFRVRLVVGVVFAAAAAVIGLILTNQEGGPPAVLLILTIAGPALLAAAILLLGSQMWAATWPAEYVSTLRKAAAIEDERRERKKAVQSQDEGTAL